MGRIDELDPEVTYPDDTLTESQRAALSPDDLAALAAGLPVLSAAGRQALSLIQTDELALAAVVNACDGTVRERLRLESDVAVPYEQAFIDAHAEQLAAIRSGGG